MIAAVKCEKMIIIEGLVVSVTAAKAFNGEKYCLPRALFHEDRNRNNITKHE
jgi:hypothetical protein